jgi:hypothetical protein
MAMSSSQSNSVLRGMAADVRDAQLKLSYAVEALHKLRPGSLEPHHRDLFFIYGRQIFDAIDRAKEQ